MHEDLVLPDDTLADVGLYTETTLLGSEVRYDREAGATLVRPMVFRLGDPDGAELDFLVCFPFDLHRLSGGRTYESVTLAVGFSDARAAALRLDPGAGTVLEPGRMLVSARGRGGREVKWSFRSEEPPLPSDGYWSQAVVRLPSGRETVGGVVSLEAELRRSLLGRYTLLRSRTLETVPFEVPVAEAWSAPGPVVGSGPAVAALPPLPEDDAPGPWQTRVILAVDLERYSRRDDVQMGLLQRDLWRVLRAACGYAGVDFAACRHQASGDGYLLILPGDLDEPAAVAGLLEGLALGLDAVNTAGNRPAGLGPARLRAAVHQGLVATAPTGFPGAAVVTACRILDSSPLREALAASATSDLAIAFSDTVHSSFIGRGHRGLDADGFTRHPVKNPDKDFEASVWIGTRPRPSG